MNLSSENINELAAALAKAQGEITCAIKDGLNPHFKSKYATLSSVWNACRDQLSKNGLSVVQTTQPENDQLILVTTLMHASGQWIKSLNPVIAMKSTPQAIGSATTYARRYALAAIVGVAPDDDDDANEAQASNHEMKTESKPVPFVLKKTTINQSQANTLKNMLEICDDAFNLRIRKFVKENCSDDMTKLPLELYDKMILEAKKNADDYAPVLAEKRNLEAQSKSAEVEHE